MRIEFDKEFKANSITKASEKFAKLLRKKGYDWAADEMLESVENGYFCCSNAMEHNIAEGKVTYPKTSDWTYYWSIENLYDNIYYASFIERV